MDASEDDLTVPLTQNGTVSLMSTKSCPLPPQLQLNIMNKFRNFFELIWLLS